jgi:hypothetical protein
MYAHTHAHTPWYAACGDILFTFKGELCMGNMSNIYPAVNTHCHPRCSHGPPGHSQEHSVSCRVRGMLLLRTVICEDPRKAGHALPDLAEPHSTARADIHHSQTIRAPTRNTSTRAKHSIKHTTAHIQQAKHFPIKTGHSLYLQTLTGRLPTTKYPS